MSRRRHGAPLGPRDRIAAFAEATEAYAETLEDNDLANVYWGKSLGLRQALAILSAEDAAAPKRQVQGPAAVSAPRRAGRVARTVSSPPVFPQLTGQRG